MITEEQKRERRNYIGGSDVGAICGLNPYATPVDKYLEKLGLKETSDFVSVAAEWGNDLELPLLHKFEKTTGKKIKINNETRYNKDHPFLAANIDGFISDKELVEIKCVTPRCRDQWDDEVPPSYLCQVAHYAYIYDIERVYFGVFLGTDKPFLIRTYERNEEFEKQIKLKCIDFWYNNVKKEIAPIPSNITDIKNLIGASTESITKIATNDICEKIYKISAINHKISELKDLKETMMIPVMEFMADAEVLYDIGNVKLATFKNNNEINQAKLKANYPEVAEECRSTKLDIKKLRANYHDIANSCTQQSSTRPFVAISWDKLENKKRN